MNPRILKTPVGFMSLEKAQKFMRTVRVGDVVHVKTSKNPRLIVDMDMYSFRYYAKILGIDRTRHTWITPWDVERVDVFLTAAYKANADNGR